MTQRALFTPLGVSNHRSEVWFHIQVGDVVRCYRPTQAMGMGFLLSLNPNLDHWRASFPTPLGGKKVDALQASAYVQRLCIAAGEYDPEKGGEKG